MDCVPRISADYGADMEIRAWIGRHKVQVLRLRPPRWTSRKVTALQACELPGQHTRPLELEHHRAVDEQSGIGGRMTRKRTKGKRTAETNSGGTRELAGVGLTQESATAMLQVAELGTLDPPRLQKWMNEPKDASQQERGSNTAEGSPAMAWMAEPEWQGESSEAGSETAVGSREPECTLD